MCARFHYGCLPLGMGTGLGAGSGCVIVSVVCVCMCLKQLRAYVRRKITTGSQSEKEGALRMEQELRLGERTGCKQGILGEGGREHSPEGCCLSSAVTMATSVLDAPHPHCQDNDTTGWEGVWGVVSTD